MGTQKRWDVIIVGGGAAGCVVAARLSENLSRSVLLVEAGRNLRGNGAKEMRDGWNIPRRVDDWGFESEVDERGVIEQLTRGRLLGGTSWMTRFAVRGSPADFEEWRALGNVGWGFEDVLPYFTRLESDVEFGELPWHGDNGPIPVTRYSVLELTAVGAAAFEALEAVGFPAVDDHNRPGAIGAGRMPMSSRDGIRVSTADAYLPLGGTPSNLTIFSETEVSQVVFKGNRATGVRVLDGSVLEASWVVLCAGTYASPAILMRSGVGPVGHLRSIGIPVTIGLEWVGSNLADHPGVDIDPGYRGPGRAAPVLHSIATFHSSAAPTGGPPDLMLWISDPSADPPGFSIDVVLLKPLSRGTVRLRSNDPTDPPRIDLPNLRVAADVERLAEGYRRGWEVASTSEMRHLCSEVPSPEVRDGSNLCDLIKENSYSDPHVVGTCAMGPSPDRGAVVDASGNVHGTERLSVVDASIMPTAISGFPHLATIMIAERLSERIAALL